MRSVSHGYCSDEHRRGRAAIAVMKVSELEADLDLLWSLVLLLGVVRSWAH